MEDLIDFVFSEDNIEDTAVTKEPWSLPDADHVPWEMQTISNGE